jgi:hypothetical protein
MAYNFGGQSFVAGPQGEIIFSAPHDTELNAVIEIDKQRTEDVRRIWPFLRDRRIDAYQDILKRYVGLVYFHSTLSFHSVFRFPCGFSIEYFPE